MKAIGGIFIIDDFGRQRVRPHELLNRWIFPYIFLVSMAALFQGILNAHHRFAISAAAPVFMNVGFILTTLALARRFSEPAYALAAGVLVGGLLQMVVQWPQLAKLKAVGKPALGWRDPAVRSVLLLAAPRLFAYGINTINTVISTRFAASLGNANVSHFYYANRLKELVLGGFARTVLGFTPSASRDLIRLLQDYITRPENTVRWRWREGDLAIWDNRATQHYAIADYGTAHRRGERGKKGREPWIYAYWGIGPKRFDWVKDTYRSRFGIETSYRQMNQCRIRTTSKRFEVRFLYVAIAMLLRNLWVWLHHCVLSSPRRGGRRAWGRG